MEIQNELYLVQKDDSVIHKVSSNWWKHQEVISALQ